MKRKRIHGRQVVDRLFVCRSLGACLALGLDHAVGVRDKDLKESLLRIDALLDHEMKTFLQLPVGVRDE